MCRIAYIPNPRTVGLGKLTELFLYLKKVQGGHGNGLAILLPGGKLSVVKGLNETCEDLARIAWRAGDPCLFHTRLASVGGKLEGLCQPILCGDIALAHNGTWSAWKTMCQDLLLGGYLDGRKPINDSVAAASLVANFGRYSLDIIGSGVFVIMSPDGVYLHLNSGTFGWCEDLQIYASDFPLGWKSKSIANDTIAKLLHNGPEFECGGWFEAKIYRYVSATYGANKKSAKEDGGEKAASSSDYHPGWTWNPAMERWENLDRDGKLHILDKDNKFHVIDCTGDREVIGIEEDEPSQKQECQECDSYATMCKQCYEKLGGDYDDDWYDDDWLWDDESGLYWNISDDIEVCMGCGAICDGKTGVCVECGGNNIFNIATGEWESQNFSHKSDEDIIQLYARLGYKL